MVFYFCSSSLIIMLMYIGVLYQSFECGDLFPNVPLVKSVYHLLFQSLLQ